MTLFPSLGTHWPFRYSLLVKMSLGIASPKYQGLDESLILLLNCQIIARGGGGATSEIL